MYWRIDLKNFSIFDPRLLSAEARKQPLKIFLCGPGEESRGFDDREFIKKNLSEYKGVSVTYGEEIEEANRFKKRGQDLQTLEAEFAHSVDFTVLILNSPGSIAELGTFSMIPNIRSRLFVVVSTRFYGSKSYIARGPLSLIASSQMNNVIYYDEDDRKKLAASLMLPVSLYKYARFDSWDYWATVFSGYRRKGYEHDYYEKLIEPIRQKYFQTAVFASMLMLTKPTFAEVVAFLGVNPSIVNEALGGLYDRKLIVKSGGGVYTPIKGYEDSLLKAFSSTELSKFRSRLIAA